VDVIEKEFYDEIIR